MLLKIGLYNQSIFTAAKLGRARFQHMYPGDIYIYMYIYNITCIYIYIYMYNMTIYIYTDGIHNWHFLVIVLILSCSWDSKFRHMMIPDGRCLTGRLFWLRVAWGSSAASQQRDHRPRAATAATARCDFRPGSGGSNGKCMELWVDHSLN